MKMLRSAVPAAGLILGLAACGEEASDTADADSSSELADASASESADVAEPEERADLSKMSCPFASNEEVNAIYTSILGNTPFVVDRLEPDECVWNNGNAVSMSIERRPLGEAKDPAKDQYNMDIDPQITELAGPGENAVILSDEVLEGPYALYFETADTQIRIRTSGLATTQDKLAALAETVAENADATIPTP